MSSPISVSLSIEEISELEENLERVLVTIETASLDENLARKLLCVFRERNEDTKEEASVHGTFGPDTRSAKRTDVQMPPEDINDLALRCFVAGWLMHQLYDQNQNFIYF